MGTGMEGVIPGVGESHWCAEREKFGARYIPDQIYCPLQARERVLSFFFSRFGPV